MEPEGKNHSAADNQDASGGLLWPAAIFGKNAVSESERPKSVFFVDVDNPPQQNQLRPIDPGLVILPSDIRNGVYIVDVDSQTKPD